MDKEFETFELPGGVRVIHKQIPGSTVGHLGFFINAGTRDEQTDEQGIAHFLEHALFKGTKKRRTFHILSRLDCVGGDLNAFTTKEDTCVYASFKKEHYSRAADLITDIMFGSVFPEKEIMKEREVIVDEILSYLDSPGEQIYDDYEQILFRGNTLGHAILGTPESVRSITPEKLTAFCSKHYTAGNLVVSSAGPLTTIQLKKLLSRYLDRIPPTSSPTPHAPFLRNEPCEQKIVKPIHQAHAVIGGYAYEATHQLRPGLVLLNNILGGPAMNSRLNLSIREKYGFTYHIESSYAAYTDTGMFSVYLSCDPKYLNKSLALVRKELDKLKNQKLSTQQLHQAKQQLYGQMALGMESKSSQMLGLGKSMLLYDRVDTIEEITAKIEALTSANLLEIANEVMDQRQFTTLIYTTA